MNRRNFLKRAGGTGALIGTGMSCFLMDLYAFGKTANLSMIEAKYYKKLVDREIECDLCPRTCKLGDKERGYCGVRENMKGTYYTLVYGKACSVHIDPIEKKPFFHFLPSSRALSLATAGCNVNCKFCQNWEISQVRPEQVRNIDLSPSLAATSAGENRCPVIAYTYSEPIVFYEYMYDTSVEARKRNIRNAVVTGGYINPDPLLSLLDVVDAIKVDLKSFSEKFYKDYVRGELQPVLEAIKLINKSPVWLEIVYLVIPTLNDSPDEIKKLSRWIMSEIGPEVPIHFSRFHPMYLLKNLPPTPISILERTRRIAMEEGLQYVYIGNVPGHEAEDTICPKCHRIVLQRSGYLVQKLEILNEKCRFCGHPIPGVWS